MALRPRLSPGVPLSRCVYRTAGIPKPLEWRGRDSGSHCLEYRRRVSRFAASMITWTPSRCAPFFRTIFDRSLGMEIPPLAK